MAEDEDEKPLVGGVFGQLGVRTPETNPGRATDVVPDKDGYVDPVPREGMSTVLDPVRAHKAVRPRALGGRCDLPLWSIDPEELGDGLTAEKDAKNHVSVKPGERMHIDLYQDALGNTRDSWRKEDPEGFKQ